MRHLVRLEVRSTVKDAAGEAVEVWNVFAQRRAALQRTPGREVFASAERQSRVPVILRLRWLEGVTDAMRLVFRCGCCQDRGVHDVKSPIDPTGLREELLITAEEHAEETP
jgi:head-tail adaptor